MNEKEAGNGPFLKKIPLRVGLKYKMITSILKIKLSGLFYEIDRWSFFWRLRGGGYRSRDCKLTMSHLLHRRSKWWNWVNDKHWEEIKQIAALYLERERERERQKKKSYLSIASTDDDITSARFDKCSILCKTFFSRSKIAKNKFLFSSQKWARSTSTRS